MRIPSKKRINELQKNTCYVYSVHWDAFNKNLGAISACTVNIRMKYTGKCSDWNSKRMRNEKRKKNY